MFCIHKIISSNLIVSRFIYKANPKIMRFIFYPRLQTYHSLIGVYDLSDKYKFSVIKFEQLDNVKFCYQLRKVHINNLNLLLFKEFLSQKRFSINKMSKLSFINSSLTLRNVNLFNCLEVLLNSYFLNSKHNTFFFNTTLYSTILNVSPINEFFNDFKINFNLIEKQLRYNMVLQFKTKNIFLSSFLTYYFIVT